MSVLGETCRVALADFYYFRRNCLLLLVTSMVTPLLYMLAFGYGLGQGVIMEGVDYIAFMIPGVISLTTLTSTFDTVSHKIMVQKRFYESFDEMLLCPVSKTSIIFGKALLGVVKGMMCGTILVAMGMMFTSDLHITVQLFLLMLASCFVFSILGVAAGVIVQDLAHMSLFTTFVILPMTFLCGTMFSLDALPQALATVIDILPLSQTSACIRAVALDWAFPWMSLALLAVYGVIFYLLAHFALNRN